MPAGNETDVLTALINIVTPTGTMVPTFATTEPAGDGWKLCNGQSLSKQDFPSLYAIFGDQFGQTETDFTLPDLQGRTVFGAADPTQVGALLGSNSISLAVGNLPPHDHGVTDPGHNHTFTGVPHTHGITDPGHAQAAAGTGSPIATGDGGTQNVQTGISVNDAIAAGTISSETTGISIDQTGNGQPIDITPASIGVNWLVRT